MTRTSTVVRKTKETQIEMTFTIDGSGKYDIATGVGFLDHMLELFTKHGMFDMTLHCTGDTHVDAHHSVEDIGIVLGMCIKEALGEKKSIVRYGSMMLPMDEVLALVSLDLSGRPFLQYKVDFANELVGDMETELVEEFFRAVSTNAGMNLHIKLLEGGNNHHVTEAIFKAFAKALDQATKLDDRIDGVMSTKGSI
ncbi:MAG: imidazoleglycerol-phosphate dehydratase HisB [Clostridia bacterium]